MMFRGLRFNVYLWLAVAAAAWCGCSTENSRHKKQLTLMRIHLEINTDDPKTSQAAPIGRTSPVVVNVEIEPFLTQVHVKEAEVIDTPGGFALRLKFGKQGSRLLEQFSTTNRGKRFAIFCRFVSPPDRKLNLGRWLAAPRITQHIGDGYLTFTPDATREEAVEIARGLNNVGKKLDPESKW
jgi:preprotein translocase subunit SecD